MLPGLDKLGPMPTAGELFLPTAMPSSEIVSAPLTALRGGQKVPKRGRNGDGGKGGVVSAGRVCKQLGAVNAQTALDAEHLYLRSPLAQSLGVEGVATCALIACKLNEVDTCVPEDVCEVAAIKGSGAEYDPEGYPSLERRILTDVGWSTISQTAAATAARG